VKDGADEKIKMSNASKLRDILLTHGGKKVVGLGIDRKIPGFDIPAACVKPLIEFGKFASTQGAKLRKRGMEANRCHDNASRLVEQGKEPERAVGFALTNDDGLWRPHSWCMSKKGTVVETTELRDVYFGVVMY
jgi:hypothetical protein